MPTMVRNILTVSKVYPVAFQDRKTPKPANECGARESPYQMLVKVFGISNNSSFLAIFQQPPRPARKHWPGRPRRACPSKGGLMDRLIGVKLENYRA